MVRPCGRGRGSPVCGPVRMVHSVVAAMPLVVVLGRVGVWLKIGRRSGRLVVSEVAWVGE